tara:strand:- start:109 stop:375 length:267 start_codon:yes stop_codon:yes gene_type:complete
MLYGVKIYDKFMNLVKELTPKQVLKQFWKDKEKSLKPTQWLKYHKQDRKKQEASFKNSHRKRDDESNTTGNNTRRKGKKRVRRSGRAR